MGEAGDSGEEFVAKITDGLQHLAFPIADLVFMPGNPNEGDVEYVARMYDEFGQTKPTICKKLENGKGLILAGNTGVRAVRDILGWTHVAVNWVEDWDDAKSKAYVIGDNESARRAHENLEYKAAMLEDVAEQPHYLDVLDFDLADIQEMVERANQEDMSFLDPDYTVERDDEEEDENDTEDTTPTPKITQKAVIQYTIFFDDEDQQQTWFTFLRWLKSNYEDDTLGERLHQFLGSLNME